MHSDQLALDNNVVGDLLSATFHAVSSDSLLYAEADMKELACSPWSGAWLQRPFEQSGGRV